MLLKIILSSIVLAHFVNCLEEQVFRKNLSNDSLQELYEKFEQNSNNPKELNAIHKLSQIFNDIKEFENQLSKEPKNRTKLKSDFVDRKVTDFITEVVLKMAKVVEIRSFWIAIKEGFSTALTCLACQSIIQIIFSRLFGAETLAFAFIQICYALDLTEYEVCDGYVSSFKDQVDYIRQHTRMDVVEMCGIIMSDQCYAGDSKGLYWTLPVPEKSEHKIEERAVPQHQKKWYNILHITDIHLDMDYIPHMGGGCRTPYCCRKGAKTPEPNMSVNYWGSYPCDTPIQTLDNWVRNVDWNSIDWTYWTGDVVPHDSWDDSRFKALQTSKVINNYFKTFSKNKLVISAIGNHIAIPIGSFPPPLIENDLSISWLYDELAKEWSHWLPEEALDSVRYGGYYALKLKPGFRVIVLNTNYCARLNIWTLYNSVDPADQLKWLIHQLAAAEEAGDLVHILGHLPPDNRECTQSWLFNFLAIVERYSQTIVGQFYGHTHLDEFRVLYSVQNSTKAIGLAIISPSLTTYIDVNPSYRIIFCNKFGQIIDMKTFAFDLLEANTNTRSLPHWFEEYSMAKTYSIDCFDGQTFDNLIKSIESDEDLLQMFHTLSHRNSSFAKSYCDKECKSRIVYDTVIGNPFQQKLKPLIET